MANAAQDAVDRYMANRKPAPPKVPTAQQAEAAGQRRGEALNAEYYKKGYKIASLEPFAPSTYNEKTAGGGDTAGSQKPTDWSSYLGFFGLPADVVKELNAIFQRTPDVNQATSLAVAYVRGTDWYAQTYPGIGEAIAKGLVRDERDYRSRMNDFSQVYRQWANRDVTATEYADHLREGVSADVVGRRFQGASLSNVYQDDWQFAAGNFGEGRLTGDELGALGRQQAGIDSELGLRVQRRIQMANERIRAVFSGQLATRKMAEPLAEQGLPDIGR